MMADRGVIVAQGPEKVLEAPGTWVLAADCGGIAAELAAAQAARCQTVELVDNVVRPDGNALEVASNVVHVSIEMESLEFWRTLLADLPKDIPLNGVVHLA